MKSRPIQITLSQAVQVTICIACPYSRCAQGQPKRCPAVMEQRRIWKAWNQTRHAYWKAYDDARKDRPARYQKTGKRRIGGGRKPSYTTLKAREEVNLNGIEKDGKQP